jgi:mersacidin/lichenicidin family type 2 lantibiotic
MKHLDVIRAGKDAEYRLTLSDAKRAAGLMELTDPQLDQVQGGGFFGPFVIGAAIVYGAVQLFKEAFGGSSEEKPPSVPYPGYQPPIMS